MLNIFNKKKKDNNDSTILDKERIIENKMVEYITLRCSCGEVVLDEERDIFMMGFESENDLEGFKSELSLMCNPCKKEIGYDDLNDKSKKEFEECVKFFIEEIYR